MKNPIVELDGDETTRIIWKKYCTLHVPLFLDVELTLAPCVILFHLDSSFFHTCSSTDIKYFDLGLEYRNECSILRRYASPSC